MKVTGGVGGIFADELTVVVERAVLAQLDGAGVVRRQVYNHLDALLMGRGHEVVEGCPRVVDITEMLLDALEVAWLIPVVRGGGPTARRSYDGVQVVHGRRDPDGRDAQSCEVGKSLPDAFKITAPVSPPVLASWIVHACALRRVVIRGVAVEEAVGDDLVDDLPLEVRRGRDTWPEQQKQSGTDGRQASLEGCVCSVSSEEEHVAILLCAASLAQSCRTVSLTVKTPIKNETRATATA